MTNNAQQFDLLRDEIGKLQITWEISGINNDKPVRTFEKFGCKARIAFNYDRNWGSVVNNRGQLFPEGEEAQAIKYAEDSIRAALLTKANTAQKILEEFKKLKEALFVEEENQARNNFR